MMSFGEASLWADLDNKCSDRAFWSTTEPRERRSVSQPSFEFPADAREDKAAPFLKADAVCALCSASQAP